MSKALSDLRCALDIRFSDASSLGDGLEQCEPLAAMAARGSCRTYSARAVDGRLLRTLCAVALSAPTKSDLQQRDIIIVADSDLRKAINRLIADQEWIAGAPALLVFCGNNRRQRLIHQWRDHPFVNDHLDAFFNAAVDGAIALGAFVTAAEAIGLGCCPISAVRNEAQAISELLALPDHAFPVAGLAVGWPSEPATISSRLPLSVTLHENRYGEDTLEQTVSAYDRARSHVQPYQSQRHGEEFGHSESYGWSEDKARQYTKPERTDFGAFVRRKGFDLR